MATLSLPQMLASLALMRGFMKPGGVPDHFRAAKLILKDLVQGKLLYCKAPPGVHQGRIDRLGIDALTRNLTDTFTTRLLIP